MTTIDLQATAQELAKYSDAFESVTVEYPGYILAIADGAAWVIGDANGSLGADYYESVDNFRDGHSPNKSIDIAVPKNARAADAAAAIFSAIAADKAAR